MSVNVTLTDIKTSSRRPKTSRMLCLPLEYVNGFLFGINPKRVKPEVKENLLRYQRECYRILADAFLTHSPKTSGSGKAKTAVTATEASLLQVREMGMAIVRMAEEQIEFERRLNTTETRLDKAAIVIGDVRKRLTAVEQRLPPGDAITDAQTSQISQAVKVVAFKLEEQSGRKEFGGVYGRLYEMFSITSYKLLPIEKFADAMQFLTEWYVNLTGDDAPF
ncbi:MAG: hypothetical protein GWP17_02725 [Aquificales bacterium]|nr:hypothetical protein [Aquificales bacterium]